MRTEDALSHQPLMLFTSGPEVKSKGVTQYRPSTGSQSILLHVGDDEAVADPAAVVDVLLLDVGDDEVIIDQVTMGCVTDIVNIDDFLRESRNHCVFGGIKNKKYYDVIFIHVCT